MRLYSTVQCTAQLIVSRQLRTPATQKLGVLYYPIDLKPRPMYYGGGRWSLSTTTYPSTSPMSVWQGPSDRRTRSSEQIAEYVSQRLIDLCVHDDPLV